MTSQSLCFISKKLGMIPTSEGTCNDFMIYFISRTENYTNLSTDINSYQLCVWKLETVWVQQKNRALTSDFCFA